MICENYNGIKPGDIPYMTMNDILILTVERKTLLGYDGSTKISTDEAKEMGLIKTHPSGKSVAKRVMEQHQEEFAIEELREALKTKTAEFKAEWESIKPGKPFPGGKRLRKMQARIDERAKKLEEIWIHSV